MAEEKAIPTNITLYPDQIAIVENFAEQDGRKFSNAVQFIIEDWAQLTGHRLVPAKKQKPVREVAR